MNQARIGMGFSLPTPEQVRDHLELHPPVMPSRAHALLPLVLLGVAVGLTLLSPTHPAAHLSWPLMIAAVGYTHLHAARQQRLAAKMTQVEDMVVLRQYPQALMASWTLLPQLSQLHMQHNRCLAAMAESLDHLRGLDAAVIVYDQLIDQLPGEHPLQLQFRLKRTLAQLAGDHLTDADDSLRRLRGNELATRAVPGNPYHAAYRLAQHMQHVLTRHDADALASESTFFETIRPLGLEAAPGYALMALALRRSCGDSDALERAGLWWSRATLLLPVQVLVSKLPDVGELSSDPAMLPYTRSCLPPVSS